jgi:hypothetical protein
MMVNPYVGPRTFQRDERHLFFGREREARDLSGLLSTEQLVLFYAQSGAGKSSLINTQVIPSLEEKRFEVLPVGRVSGELPSGLAVNNIYVFNLIRSLVHGADLKILAHLSLAEFFKNLTETEAGYVFEPDSSLRAVEETPRRRRALIIDQFEELFTTHPQAWQQREGFFDQLGQALDANRSTSVMLVMREDFIASLEPFAYLVPGRLRGRYYMQRLERTGALAAIRKPVEPLRPYEPGVAEKLVEDLSSIKVQNPDGSLALQPGQYVEPVQLQVICYSLWDNLPLEGTSITENDLMNVGDTNEALGRYYAGRVAAVSQAKGVKERLLREWIERNLISPGGVRNMVLQEPGRRKDGIGDDVIQALQSDLVRAERRGGAIFYELTHDRLIQPILENNNRWFDENLSPLQRQAALWSDQGRGESWLLRDQALEEVEKWAEVNLEELTELEAEFLEACRHQQQYLKLHEYSQMARRTRKVIALVGFLSLIILILLMYSMVITVSARRINIQTPLLLPIGMVISLLAGYWLGSYISTRWRS